MNFEESLHKKMRVFAEPTRGQVDACRERVWKRLSEDSSPVYGGLIELLDRRSPRRHKVSLRLVAVLAVASAILLAQQLATRSKVQDASNQKATPPAVAVSTPAASPLPPQQPRGTPRLEFAAASIRVMPPKTMMTSAGLSCHGKDGVKRAVLIITTDAQGAITAPQGRCVGRGVFLSTLIEVAYGVTPRQIAGGTDWARTSGSILEFGRGGNFVGLPADDPDIRRVR
jgi:hypothetical protein